MDLKKATPHDELIAELLDSTVPKTEREHAAAREIEELRKAVAVKDDAVRSVLCHIRSHGRTGMDVAGIVGDLQAALSSTPSGMVCVSAEDIKNNRAKLHAAFATADLGIDLRLALRADRRRR